MKRFLVFLTLIVFLGVYIWACPLHYAPVAAMDNVCFGMQPYEVMLDFGVPDRVESSRVAPEITYFYRCVYMGSPADFSCTFIRTSLRTELNRMSLIVYDADDALVACMIDLGRSAFACRQNYSEITGASSAVIESGVHDDYITYSVKTTDGVVTVISDRFS